MTSNERLENGESSTSNNPQNENSVFKVPSLPVENRKLHSYSKVGQQSNVKERYDIKNTTKRKRFIVVK